MGDSLGIRRLFFAATWKECWAMPPGHFANKILNGMVWGICFMLKRKFIWTIRLFFSCFSYLLCPGCPRIFVGQNHVFFTLNSASFKIHKLSHQFDSAFNLFFNSSIKFSTSPYLNIKDFHLTLECYKSELFLETKHLEEWGLCCRVEWFSIFLEF